MQNIELIEENASQPQFRLVYERAQFWAYCVRVTGAARSRARAKKVDAHFVDRLFVDQGWKCAVTGIPFSTPGKSKDYTRDPFAPSLDRIVPARGYASGNVRLVCNIVNISMNQWGLDNFLKMVAALKNHKQ